MEIIDNLNIVQFKPLITPHQLKAELPQTSQTASIVAASRNIIQNILTNKDNRRLIIAGPCSLHDRKASLEYAQRLSKLQQQVADKILIVMRAYFEKPRTTLGWKGMLYDPCLDGSYNIEQGFRRARRLLLDINRMNLPTATEFLEPIVPQYLADLISWAAIGARTIESQIHRQMASGLSMPIGFKNATDGNLTVAIDAVKAAASPHSFMGIDSNGKVIIAETRGNKYSHLVMRGGTSGPNYASQYVAFAQVLLQKANITTGVIIDCSHANSYKDHTRQQQTFFDVTDQIRRGSRVITGLMLESFLKPGSQPSDKPENLQFGLSVTDSCIGWDETEHLICHLADS